MNIHEGVRKFLITGHSRSGTGYMHALFNSLGFDVGHEKVRSDGISACHFAVPGYRTEHGDVREHWTFLSMIQVVRHPIKVVSSVYHTEPDHIPHLHRNWIKFPYANRLEECVWSVCLWNRKINIQNPSIVVQVESASEVIPRWLSKMKVPYNTTGDLPPTNYNSRPHENILFDEIKKSVSPEAVRALEAHAKTYDYDLVDLNVQEGEAVAAPA